MFACCGRRSGSFKTAMKVGAVTGTDVDQAQAQIASGEASLHSAESTLMTTKPIIGASSEPSPRVFRPDAGRSVFRRARWMPPSHRACRKIRR